MKHHSPQPTEIATPAQEAALRRNQAQRMKDLAEGLLRAYETAEVPKDHAGIDRAAKALISLNKVMKTLYNADTSMAKKPELVRDADGAWGPEIVDEAADAQALTSWLPVLTRKLDLVARVGREKRIIAKAEEMWPLARDVDG
jgi:hypothetical protein